MCLYFLKRSKRFQYRNVFYLLLKEIIRCFNAYGAGIEVTIDNICWQENKWICHIMVEMSLDICVLTYLKQHSKYNSNSFKITMWVNYTSWKVKRNIIFEQKLFTYFWIYLFLEIGFSSTHQVVLYIISKWLSYTTT